MPAAPNETELDRADMQRLTAGHDAALNSLMERHGERLFHYLIRSLQNEGEAEDLAQETFVRVYQNRHKYHHEQKFTTWIYAIASNLVRDRYRWRTRHPQVPIESNENQERGGLKETLPTTDLTPAEHIWAAERARAVQKAVARLPSELRTPLVLSEYEDCSHSEIASILHCSTKAVETRIYRARNQLRQWLVKYLA